MSGIEKEKTAKKDVVAALEASFTFCESAFTGMTGARANETVKFEHTLPGTHTRLGILAFNNAHDFEHDGNVVTYMRLEGHGPTVVDEVGGPADEQGFWHLALPLRRARCVPRGRRGVLRRACRRLKIPLKGVTSAINPPRVRNVRRSPSHPHAPIRVPDIEPARAACAGAAIEWSE